jgi:UrcA family protein
VKKLALTVSLALATVAFAAPSFARSDEPRQVSVSLADLNLDSPAGAESAYRRLESAARKVCKGAESRSASTQVEWKRCMSHALGGAVASVDHAGVSGLHLAKTGDSSSVAKK